MSKPGVDVIKCAVNSLKTVMKEDRFTRIELECIRGILLAAVKATNETLQRGPEVIDKENKQ